MARAAEAAEAPPQEPAVAEVAAALAGVSGLPPACLEMLRASAPHCLRVPKAERHAFQASLAEALARLFAGEEVTRREAVAAVETEVAALRAEEAAAGEAFEAARTAAAAAAAARHDAQAAHGAAGEASGAARAGLAAARQRGEERTAEVKALEARRAALQASLAECWEPLEGGGFTGREWRKRDKAIARIAELLREFDAPESLQQGACTAFRTKTEERGRFAQQALVYAKAAFSEQIEGAKAKAAALEVEAAAGAQAVEEATTAVQVAEAREDAALEAAMEADSAWAQAESRALELRDGLRAFGPRAHALAQKLDGAKAALADAARVAAKLAALDEPPATAGPGAPGTEAPAADAASAAGGGVAA